MTLYAGTLASAASATSYIAGAVSTGAGTSTIAPGGVGTIGTLDLGSTLALTGTATLNFDISGSSSDQLNVTSTLTETGTPTITLGSGNTYTRGMTYTLANYATSTVPTFTDTAPSGFTFSITSTQIQLLPIVTTDTWSPGTPPNSTASGTWDINTTPNWTIAGTSGSYYNEGDNVIFNDIGSLTSGAVTVASGGVNPGSVTFGNNTTAYTFSGGPIGGVGRSP